MSIRIVHIKQQTTQTLAVGEGECVVVRVSDSAPGRESPILRLHKPGGETVIGQCKVHFCLSVRPIVTGEKPGKRIAVECLSICRSWVAQPSLEVIHSTN